MQADFEVLACDRVAVFRIQRPAQANALSRSVLLALGRFAREAGADPGVRALVVTGAGQRHFCAGADLKERAGWDDDEVRRQLQLYRSELGALEHCPKPVAAAINGLAWGGGLEIALACDLRVCAASASFACPEVTLGIIPGAGGTQRLTRIIGPARTKEMILLGRPVQAAQALELGLVNRVSPPGDVLDDTLAWLEPIVRGAPLAHRAALAAIDAASPDAEPGLEAERLAYEAVLGSEDRREGLRAFAEKRPAVWRGR
jgi:enoyl-CoA hydratase/carnithine racemase